MSLPRKIKLFFFAYLSLFLLFSAVPSLAFATHDGSQSTSNVNTTQSNQQQNQIGQPDSIQSPDVKPIPPPTNQDIQPIPKPEGEPEIQQAQVGAIISFTCKIFSVFGGCEGIFEAVKAAFSALMEFIVEIFIGGPFDIVSINEKLSAYEKGIDDPSQIPNPGLFDYAGLLTESALDLNVPISSGQYFASINPFAQAQAQEGAQGLAESGVVLEVWQRVRNVAYALSAVVLVIIGFMIMIRWRLDPRTVVTIQNSLPRIVIALILITFSFAIAGLMIDLTRLVTDVIMSLVDVPGGKIAGFALALIGGSIAAFAIPFIGQAVGILGIVIALIIVLVVAFIFVVLIFKLLTRYVIFLLLTIFSPLFFLAGALPGGEGLILNWFKRQAAALLAIPMTALFVNLSLKIGFGGSLTDGFPSPWPLIGPLSSVFGGVLLFPFVGLGLFFFATKVPDIVDEMFGIKEMGARKGIGPGSIIGVPMGALSTLGTVGRAAPMIAGATMSMARQGGIRGRLAGVLYGASQPFARRDFSKSLKDLRSAQKKTEPTPQEKFQKWNEGQEAAARASNRDVSAGPEGSTTKGDTSWEPGRDKE